MIPINQTLEFVVATAPLILVPVEGLEGPVDPQCCDPYF